MVGASVMCESWRCMFSSPRVRHVLFAFKFTFLCRHRDNPPAALNGENPSEWVSVITVSFPVREHLSFQYLERQQIWRGCRLPCTESHYKKEAKIHQREVWGKWGWGMEVEGKQASSWSSCFFEGKIEDWKNISIFLENLIGLPDMWKASLWITHPQISCFPTSHPIQSFWRTEVSLK